MKALDQYITEALIKRHVSIKEDFIDFDLPSGTLWSKCNVGAKNPEDYGTYFAWGETKGKTAYTRDNYKYKFKEFWSNGRPSYKTKKYGVEDNKFVLDDNDNAAFVSNNNLTIPTKEQFDELLNYTNHKWYKYKTSKSKYVYGVLFTSKEDENIQMFIPAAGSFNDTWHNGAKVVSEGTNANVWALDRPSEPTQTCYAWAFAANETDDKVYTIWKMWGLPIRPVKK